jgi:hypothetical protein
LLAAADEETRRAILAILGTLNDRRLSTVIPACPAWTVRDLTARGLALRELAVEVGPPPERG